MKEMQILFDNPWATYYTGSQVTGQFILTLQSSKKVREIKVKFKGAAEVKWSVSEVTKDADGKERREDRDYTADETYFENKFALAGESEFPPGVHTFNFSTMLPHSLPSSYEGTHGHIRYTVKIIMDRPWMFDQECKAAFTVICPVDLNYLPEARIPLLISKEKSVGLLCCTSGPLSVTVKSPSSGYVSGQSIPITVDLENHTNSNITGGSCELRKIVTFKAQRPSSDTKVEKISITKFELSRVGANGSNTWDNVLNVPSLPATNTTSCKLITVAYDIKIKTSISGLCQKGIDLSIPVIIGTIPLVNVSPSAPEVPPPSTGQSAIGWSQGGGGKDSSAYPDLPPPTYQQSAFGKADTIHDKDDTEHTEGTGGWVPNYPMFNYTPSAPPAP